MMKAATLLLCVAAVHGADLLRGTSTWGLEPLVRSGSANCSTPALPRVDCHIDGQTACEAGGCCWFPVNPNPSNEPWCIKPGGPAPTPTPTPGKCDPSLSRTDCHIGSEDDCETAGCCWSPVSPNPNNEPWCFKKTLPDPSCNTTTPCSGHGKCNQYEQCVCNAGYQTCSAATSCAVDTASDPANCGACNNACPTGTGVASSTCSAGKCDVTCSAGYTLCFGQCLHTTNCNSTAPFTPADMEKIVSYFMANININGDGGVVASPSTSSPDYYYHWQRDAGISIRELIKVKTITEVETQLQAYVSWVRKVQFDADPNNIDIRGEPKFYLPEGKCYDKGWMRPQNDGPAVRTIAIIDYANRLLDAGQKDYVLKNIWTDASSAGIQYDLEYVISAWKQDSGDPWEEVRGQVFFDKFTMRKALLDAALLAQRLGDSTTAATYNSTAADIQANIQSVHWNADKGIIMEVPNTRELDSATHLGFLYGGNNDGFLDPDTAEAQSSVSVLVSSFASYTDFSINAKDTAAGIPGLLVGRYLQDSYNGGNSSEPGSGNAWILCTAALAENYYRAASLHATKGLIEVNDLNRVYWQQVVNMSEFGRDDALVGPSLMAAVSAAGTQTFTAPTPQFVALHQALVLTGDGILLRIRHHVKDQDMHCTEQINKDDGNPQGAQDLTWSYGTVIGAVYAREHATPSSVSW